MTSTSAKKKAPAKKKTAAKKAAPKKAEVATPDYTASSRELIRQLGFSNAPHADHVKTIASLLEAAFEHGRLVGKG